MLTWRSGSGNPIYQDCLKALEDFETLGDVGDEDEDQNEDEDEDEQATFLGLGQRASYLAFFGKDWSESALRSQLPVVKTHGILPFSCHDCPTPESVS